MDGGLLLVNLSMNALERAIYFYEILIILKFLFMLSASIAIIILSSTLLHVGIPGLVVFSIGSIVSGCVELFYVLKRLITSSESFYTEIFRLFPLIWGCYGIYLKFTMETVSGDLYPIIILLLVCSLIGFHRNRFPLNTSFELRT